MTKLFRFLKVRASFRYGIYAALLFTVLLPHPVLAQKGSTRIEGRVVDERNGEPVAGANVFLVNEKTGAVAGEDGAFTINPKSLPATVSVSYLGYRTLEVAVYEYTEPLIVYLREDLSLLNEVVVIGYGTQKRKELTGSVASVSQSLLSQITPSFDNLLGGAVSGVNVTQSSGQPGATSSIRIRGGNSITGGNEPLYVIDGFILYNDNSSTRTGAGSFDGGLNPLSSINPADIESIEVLKDVSATAIYGSRGANGVILISTKKGKKGSNGISYQTSLGWSQVSKKLDLLNANQWADLYSEITGKTISASGESSDWQDAALQTGSTQTHQLSVSGGDERTRYLLSGNYTGQDGVIRNTDFNRYSGRLNLDRDVFKNFNVGTNLILSQSVQHGLTNLASHYSTGRISGTFDYAVRLPPAVPIYAKDGDFNYNNPYVDQNYLYNGLAVNPISDLVNTKAETKNNSVVGSFYAKYTIIPALTAKLNSGVNISNTAQNFYAPSTSAAGQSTSGYGSVGSKTFTSWQHELTLNYTKRINADHFIDVLAGYTTQKTIAEFATSSSSNYANESLGSHNLAGGSTLITPTSGGYESVLNSFLGRVNYSLFDRYNVTATIRADGSSRFAADHRWGYFPSLGLSWNVNQEPFFKSNVVSGLKLRLSGGTAGNQEIGDYRYEAVYAPKNYSFGGNLVTAYIRSNRENSNLKWETTVQFNAGIDLGLWKDRLTASVDVYSKETSDLLVEIPLEITSGFKTMLKNAGSVSNKGVEFELNGIIADTKSFRWTAAANIAKNSNEVTSLGGSLPYFTPVFDKNNGLVSLQPLVDPLIVKEGEPLGSFYGYVFDGVVQRGEEASAPKPSWEKGNVQAGDPKYKNTDGDKDNTITESDKVVLGSAQPDFTYGFSSALTYKNLDFSVSFQGSQGNQLYNGLRHNLETTTSQYNASAVIADRWTDKNPSTTIPRAVDASFVSLDSRFVEDASYLRLKNITVGYALPVKINKLPNAKIRLFVSAQNLFTLTPYKGYDPEASRYGGDETNSLYQGIDLGAYPAARSFLFGLNLSL
ncbi:Outer membrane cobalamin receptor protein, SusC/RagA family [Bacteroidales bacterium Barb7]|nr:Outer membrane cobalamin receptor protein, SusC/RagA family [Bacteroidales bacterium Barb7]